LARGEARRGRRCACAAAARDCGAVSSEQGLWAHVYLWTGGATKTVTATTVG
jgi:hypothetical protein